MSNRWNPLGLAKNRNRRRLSKKPSSHAMCNGKRTFRDKEEINDAIQSLKRSSSKKLRAYFCHRCRGFHLTSQVQFDNHHASVDDEAESYDSV